MRHPLDRPPALLVPDDDGVTIVREGVVIGRTDWREIHKIVGGQMFDFIYDTVFVDLYDRDVVRRVWEDVEGFNDFLQAMYRAFPTIDLAWTRRTLAHDGSYEETLYESSPR